MARLGSIIMIAIGIIPNGATQAPSCTSDSCDTFSMIQSWTRASLGLAHSTKSVDGSARKELASLMSDIERDTANLKMGDPLPEVVQTSLRTIETAIGDIQSNVEEDVNSQRESLQRLATAFQNCMNISTQSWPRIAEGSSPLKTESDHVSSLRSLHAECRIKEVGVQMLNAVGFGGTCDNFLQAIQNLESIKPDGLKQTELSRFFNVFDETAFSSKASACDSAVKSYTLTVEACTANQTAYETAVCHWHTSTRHVENACESIRSCRNIDGKLLEEECEAAKERANAWKAEEVAIKQIKCLLDKLFAGKYDEMKTCNNSIPAEGKEDYEITCPTVTTSSEEESKCSSLVKPDDITAVPGSDAWITTYSSEAWYEDAKTSANSDSKITARVQCELPQMICPEGKVLNSEKTGCETPPQVLIAAGADDACALKKGKVVCWGSAKWQFPSDNSYDRIALGQRSACARIATAKTLVCVGDDIANEIPTDKAVDLFQVSEYHACTVLQGAVTCYFTSKANAAVKNVPAEVTSLNAVDQITGGRYYVCARLASTKTVRCWGMQSSRNGFPAHPLGNLEVSHVVGDSGAHFACATRVSDSKYECFGDAISSIKRTGCLSTNEEQIQCSEYDYPVSGAKFATLQGKLVCTERTDTMQSKCYGHQGSLDYIGNPVLGAVDDIACGQNFCMFVDTTGRVHHYGRHNNMPSPLFPTD